MAKHRFVHCIPLLLSFSALDARADIAPPDSCINVGAACDNAGRAGDLPGFCVKAACTRATPDGPVFYDCLRCQVPTDATNDASTEDAALPGDAASGGALSTGGAASTGGSHAAGGTPSDAGGTASDTGGTAGSGGRHSTGATLDGTGGAKTNDDGGCSYSGRERGSFGSLLVALAALAVFARRRLG